MHQPSLPVFLLILCLSSGHSTSAVASPGLIESAVAPSQGDIGPTQYIGECWMEAEGTIRLFLRAESQAANGTIVGHVLQEYRPGDRQYDEILKHVGPMRPGHRRPVPAWPD